MNRLIKRIVIFLTRRRLGLKECECFQFVGQTSKSNYYYFTEYEVMKVEVNHGGYDYVQSSVSLNWLLNDHCKIRKTGEFE